MRGMQRIAALAALLLAAPAHALTLAAGRRR